MLKTETGELEKKIVKYILKVRKGNSSDSNSMMDSLMLYGMTKWVALLSGVPVPVTSFFYCHVFIIAVFNLNFIYIYANQLWLRQELGRGRLDEGVSQSLS